MTDIPLDELLELIGRGGVVVLDVRTQAEHEGVTVAPCDPRAGRIPGSVSLPLDALFGLGVDEVESRIGSRADTIVVAYCHSGQRSALAVEILRGLGFEARNYVGSWHEWSRQPSLPVAPEPT